MKKKNKKKKKKSVLLGGEMDITEAIWWANTATKKACVRILIVLWRTEVREDEGEGRRGFNQTGHRSPGGGGKMGVERERLTVVEYRQY